MDAETEKREYEFHWGGNASHYAEQGCYEWIASQLDSLKPKKVFDVGCGTGEGVLALRRRFGCQILSIDENAYCLRTSAARLRAEGAKVQLEERFHYLEQPSGQHAIGIKNGPISMSREMMLLQGDLLLNDRELFSFIESEAPFDAVTLWLAGTYSSRQSCINLASLKMPDPGAYRRYVQSMTYKLAARILRPGGLLHVVDRRELPTDETTREKALAAHREIAAKNGLQTLGLESRPYEELTGGRGIRMVHKAGSSGEVPADFVWGMVSALSSKP